MVKLWNCLAACWVLGGLGRGDRNDFRITFFLGYFLDTFFFYFFGIRSLSHTLSNDVPYSRARPRYIHGLRPLTYTCPGRGANNKVSEFCSAGHSWTG